MALELTAEVTKLKVTDETILWLRFKAIRTGKTHHQLARDALHELAIREMRHIHDDHRLLAALEKGEGSNGDLLGSQRGVLEK